jgi:uncharacterized protein YndB with AHSA1/START domain
MTDDAPTPVKRTIDLSTHVHAPVEAVWKALTDPAELERWFPLRSGGEAGPGKKILFSWDEGEWWTNVTEWKPNQLVRWVDDAYPDSPNPPLAVEWTLTTERGQTVVRLVHSGFGNGTQWDNMYDALTDGWTYFLRNLTHYVERHFGTPRAMAHTRRKTSVPAQTAWARLTGAEGLRLTSDDMHLGGATGTVERATPARHLWGTFPTLGDAILFIEFEGRGETYTLGVWLSTYGLAPGEVARLQGEVNALADRVLA